MNGALRFEQWIPVVVFTSGIAFVITARSDGAARSTLTVEICDGTGLDDALLESASAEATHVFGRAEVPLSWTTMCDTPPPTEATAARIYVVSELPRPIRYRLGHEHRKSNLMGYVLTSPGEMPGSVIFVARSLVERNASRSGRRNLDDSLLARALGRVFAHELAHRFLRSGHTREGILKEPFDQRDLIGDDVSGLFFTPQQVESLDRLLALDR